jgi:hypothetical protein
MPFLGPFPPPSIGTVPGGVTDGTSIIDSGSLELESTLAGRNLTVLGAARTAEGNIGELEQLMEITLPSGEGSGDLSVDSKWSLLEQAAAIQIVVEKYQGERKQLLERGRVAILSKRQELYDQIASKLQAVPTRHEEVVLLSSGMDPLVHMQVARAIGQASMSPGYEYPGDLYVIRLVYAISQAFREQPQDFHVDELNLEELMRTASATGTDTAPAPPVAL